MLDTTDAEKFPRTLSERERAWCAYILPRDRPAYAVVADAIAPLMVLGYGRWGDGDLVLGREDQTIDLTAPMEPVAAYGELQFNSGRSLSISVHHPDDEARVEIHLSGMSVDEYERDIETNRWCFSYWSPGDVSPASGTSVRAVTLDRARELVLALDGAKRLMWLHDETTKGNMLIPVTNFYNELMMLKGVRDPEIGLAHRRLFDNPDENSDAEISRAFERYNKTWRKVDVLRIAADASDGAPSTGLRARIARVFRGGPSV